MKTTHVMLDLETASTETNALILSVGAVKFNPYDPSDRLEGFHIRIDMKSYLSVGGFNMSPTTFEWWLKPELADARDKLLKLPAISLPEALYGFSDWFGDVDLPVWGNGAAFDNVVLRNALQIVVGRAPWSYKNDRCYRTLRALAPEVTVTAEGTQHDALDDAIFQAKHTQAIFAALGLKAPEA